MKGEIIEFRKKREFGDVLNITFQFLKMNFVHFFKMNMVIIIPFVLINLVIVKMMPFDEISRMAVVTSSGQKISNITALVAWIFLGFFVFILAIVSSMYQYVVLYRKHKGTNFGIAELWKGIIGGIWTMIKGYIGFAIVTIFSWFIVVLLSALIFTFFGMMGNFGGFLIGIFMIALASAFTYYSFTLSHIFVIRVFEPNTGFFSAIKRAFYLVKGKWWSCYGVSFLMGIIAFTVTSVVMLGVNLLFMLLGTFIPNGVIMLVSTVIQIFVLMLAFFLPVLASTFQYFALVEMKDATGLTEQVEKFGTISNNDENEDEKEDY